MDDVLWFYDTYLLTPYVYPESFTKDMWTRQFLSLWGITTISGFLTFYTFATWSYFHVFDKSLLQHPKAKKNQVQQELIMGFRSLPIMSLMTVPFFLLEVNGYSQLYDSIFERSIEFTLTSMFCFLLWNDCFVYWVHRALHHPFLYKRFHKPHHKWLISTPFASVALHPVDGWMQSLPYHFYVLFFPLPKWLYLVSYLFLGLWSVSIHDGYYAVPKLLRDVINGAAHHDDHHLYFNYNYGLYTTFWDRLGGSFRSPSAFQGKGPLDEIHRTQTKTHQTSVKAKENCCNEKKLL